VTVEITAQSDKREGFTAWEFWDDAHDSPSGNLVFMSETETDKAIRAQNDMPELTIFRSFFDFDLSAIPVSAVISACTLKIQNYGAGVCNASIQEGTQVGDPFGADYDAFTGVFFDTLTWTSGGNVFTLNAAGLTYIQSVFAGTAKLCMREYSHDYLDVSPAIGEDFHAGLYWSGAAAANRPKLTVTYGA